MSTPSARGAPPKGADVVHDAVKEVHALGLFPDDHGFLRRIAFVESRDGEDALTFRSGYHGGIWQVDQVAFLDTQNVKSHPSLKAKLAKLAELRGVVWEALEWEALRNPLFSALAARLFLSLKPGAIPTDLQGQAHYWKDQYNRSGKGTPEAFVARVQDLRRKEPTA